MSSLYERLFKYRANDKQTPLENYLTEALCDILNRMEIEDPQAQSGILHKLFDYTGPTPVHFQTQFPIRFPDKKLKIPDMVGCCNEKVVLLLEVKVDAAFTGDAFGGEVTQGEIEDDIHCLQTSKHQLKEYGEWLNANGELGAKLVLLTHRTPAPQDFLKQEGEYGIAPENRHVCRWQAVYDALVRARAEHGQRASPKAVPGTLVRACAEHGLPYAILGREFCQFLYTQGVAMQPLKPSELKELMDFVTTGHAKKVQDFINDLRERCKSIAPDKNMFSWEQGRSQQSGGQFLGKHLLINAVRVKDKSMQIAWGFYFYHEPIGESADPYLFHELFGIPQQSGIFLNIIHDEEKTFSESQIPPSEDWYPGAKDIPARASAVAFKSLDSFKESKDIGLWFQERFTEVCDQLKPQ